MAETTDLEAGASRTVMTSTPLLVGTEPETHEPLFREGTYVTLASGQPARYQRREPRVLHLWTAAQRSVIPRYIFLVFRDVHFMIYREWFETACFRDVDKQPCCPLTKNVQLFLRWLVIQARSDGRFKGTNSDRKLEYPRAS